MALGTYLYGFTGRGYEPGPALRGLRDAAVRTVAVGEIAAVISDHPVQRLPPARCNIQPHHRVVRHVSAETTLVPAAFGHISEREADIAGVLRINHREIRDELNRLAGKAEIGLRMTWNVPNIFNHLVVLNRELREARDKAFRGREPSINDKLQIGSLFETTLNAERARFTAIALAALEHVTGDVAQTPPRDEKMICQAALLVERARQPEFEAALARAATLFDATVAFDFSGPWPPYSFVHLRLRPSETPAAA